MSAEIVNQAAVLAWSGFTAKQKAIVRIGMIPIEAVEAAKASLGEVPDFHRLFAVAMMNCAKHDGGMHA